MGSDYEAEVAAAVTRFLADVERLAQHHRDRLMSTIAPSLAVTTAPSPVRGRPAASAVRAQPTRAVAATAATPTRPPKASSAKVTASRAAQTTTTASEATPPRRRTAPTSTGPTPDAPPPVNTPPEPATPIVVTSDAPPPASPPPTNSSPVVEPPATDAPVIAAPVLVVPSPVPEPDRPPTVRGVVKWFNVDRGYGFIQGADGRDAFVHVRALDGFQALAEGQPVEYTVTLTRKGLQAVSVARPKASARGSR